MDDFDDWDSNFLEQAIDAEKVIITSICSRNPILPNTQHHPPPPPPPSFPCNDFNFSPPREFSLSQNPTTTATTSTQQPRFPPLKSYNNGPAISSSVVFTSTAAASRSPQQQQETEVDRLKRELYRVSQQVTHLERECVELKKDKYKKEEQLWFRANDDSHMEEVAVLQDRLQISPQFQNASTSIPHARPEYARARESSGRSPIDGTNFFESDDQHCVSRGLKGKNVQVDGISATNDLRPRTLIDSALTTSNEYSAQKIVLPETTAQPKYTKAVGVQTEKDDACEYLIEKNEFRSQYDLLNKFSAIWGLPSSQRAGRSLVSKLFVMCAADFYALFRCIGMSMPSTLESFAELGLLDVTLHDKSVQSVEAAKVAHLYFVLTKINDEMMQLDGLIDALIDLCTLKTVVVVHRSLHIVRAVLQHVLGCDARFDRRDNVVVEGMHPKNNAVELDKSQTMNTGVQFGVPKNMTSFPSSDSSGTRSFDLDVLCNEELGDLRNVAFVSGLDWLSLFETIRQIAVGNSEECVQVEAISVMNLILMRSNPCLEREKFGSKQLFESLSRLLQKDVGVQARKQAVHLLFLLLNCPSILVVVCSGCKNDVSSGAAADSTKDMLTFRGFNTILEGLAECLKCRGHSTQELRLRRLTIKVLAFVAASGKSGFEVLLNPKISKGGNFLELIMLALASEMDAEAVESSEPSETCKERISLIREALIFLNRLASSPAYSGVVLQVLTSSRDTASLTIDIVNRMSRKSTDWWSSDSTKKRKAEDEIVDLSRVFRSRVFAYLGNNAS